MIIQWHALLVAWSLKLIIVSLAENSLRDPREVWEPRDIFYYIEADADPNNINSSEERKRFQRSFFKNWWKNIGLRGLFGDDRCVNCCKNDEYQAGDGDAYHTPSTTPYLPPLPPSLTPLQPLDPLGILQPLFRPMDFNNNGYVNNCGSGTNGGVNPNYYESGNNNNNPGSVDGSYNKNLNDGKSVVTYDKPNLIYEKDAYVKPQSSPESDQATVVYQPIIYVSPQYQPAAPLNSSSYNLNHGGGTTYPEYCSHGVEPSYNPQPPPAISIPSQPCRCYGEPSINPYHGIYPPKVPDPIILTAADQPYRNCPELFTEYCNKINYLY